MALGLALVSIGAIQEQRPLRFSPSALFLLLLVVGPLLQAVPLPASVRKALDPQGSALLADVAPGSASSPLSLDPPSTRADIGKAALAIVFFIVAYHLASGQRHRHLLTRIVGLVAIAAVVIGIAHKLVGVSKIYGLVGSTHRTLLIGPFVNANHTAELLELGAFACLACSFQRPTMLNRVPWLIGMALCAGGVAATLSRGGIAALGAGVVAFVTLRHFGQGDGTPKRWRSSLILGALLLGLLGLGVAALGADQLIDRFKSGAISNDVRFRVWRDSWRVLQAHPFGIGRGAFDRVYPIYRTVSTPFSLRFAFVENEPLQLLIDCGWLLCGLIFVGFGLVAWDLFRNSRRDKIEAALLAGLFAVLVHNIVDFGLEIPGVLLPFLAILATVLGRGHPTAVARVPVWGRWAAIGLAGAGCVIGIASIVRPSSDDFDAQLKKARSVAENKQILIRARAAHPVDYFYVLAYGSLEPLRGPAGQPSPRLHALNQALLLCPGCEAVHLEVGQNLWTLGMRRQALLEYRSAVTLQPTLFKQVMGELFGKGARPEELASIATFQPARMIDVARFLSAMDRVADAIIVLGQAETFGAPRTDVLLSRAAFQLQLGQPSAAETTLAALRVLRVDDPRLPLLEAQALVLSGSAPDAPDRALGLLDAAAARYPGDVDVQRTRLDLVTRYEKWGAAARALEGYKQALYMRDGTATEAHVASARIWTKMGRLNDALGEYRIALGDQSQNVALWMELGSVSESAGRLETAHEAYAMATRLSPNNPDAARGLQRLADRRHELNEIRLPPGVGN